MFSKYYLAFTCFCFLQLFCSEFVVHTIVVEKDSWYDFHILKFIETFFFSLAWAHMSHVFLKEMCILFLWDNILACASSSPAFPMMYSAYKSNKQVDSIQPRCTPFPIWNQSVVPCPVLTVGSWPAYRFLRRQVRWSGIPISWGMFQSLLWTTQSKVLA